VSHRAGLDNVEKRKFCTLPELELRPLGCTARSQSLYRLRFPDSEINADRREKRFCIVKVACMRAPLAFRIFHFSDILQVLRDLILQQKIRMEMI
jgi:hypothetical protein